MSKLRTIALVTNLTGMFGGMVIVPLILGSEHSLMRNLMPQAPIIINAQTITYSVGMVISFVVFQLMAISGKEVAPILDIGSSFLIYVLAMVFFSTNISQWFAIAGIVYVFLSVEYITINFFKRRQTIQR